MPSRRKDREGWWGKVVFQGQPYRKKFQTKREAAEWEVEKRKELETQKRQELERQKIGMGLLDFSIRYMDEAKLRFVTKTYQEKKALIERLGQEFGDIEVSAITADDIRQYLNRQAEERSASAANKDRKNLMAMWAWGRKFHGLNENPVTVIDKFPHAKGLQYTPSRVDVLKVLAAATPEEQVFLQVYLHTAARRSEIFRLTWTDDINFTTRKIRLSTRKTKDGSTKYRYLPMSDELYDTLRWWWIFRPVKDTPYVFVSTSDQHYGQPFTTRRRFLKGLCKRAGVKEFGFHAIRRHVPSFLASLGVPMIILQQLLGHERLSTTEIYMHNIDQGLAAYVNMLGETAQKKPVKDE